MDVGRDAVTEMQIIDQFKRIAENFEVTGQYWWETATVHMCGVLMIFSLFLTL